MNLDRRIKAFVQLGKVLKEFSTAKSWAGYETGVGEQEFADFNELIMRAKHYNGWFSDDNVRLAINALAENLTVDKIGQWVQKYPELSGDVKPKAVAVIMAGNIPMVGFHDMLCVLLSGHNLVGKCSSQDDKLLPAVVGFLCDIEPDFKERVKFTTEKLDNIDAVIATGSNNSARYFEYYFGKYPNIIRKNRTSVAILNGEETADELTALGNDIFSYFGLGCRNVSKIFIPKDYDLDRIFGAIFNHKDIVYNNKYANNYEYAKTLFLMNSEPLVENGFIVFKEDKGLTSPVGTLYYEYYNDKSEVDTALDEIKEEVQCVVSKDHIPFGKAQHPELWDYADDVDTMAFLLGM